MKVIYSQLECVECESGQSGTTAPVYHILITEAAALSAVNTHQSGAAECKDSFRAHVF